MEIGRRGEDAVEHVLVALKLGKEDILAEVQ